MNVRKVTKFVYKLWEEWRNTVFFIIFVIIPVKSSLADWNWVPSGSMNPTILEGELVYVDKIAYDLRLPLTFYRLAQWAKPERGDIVICFSPEDDTRLVKRVIAVPGDTIEMRKNVLFLNGRPAVYTKIETKHTEYLNPKLKKRSIFATENLDGFTHPVMSIPSIPAVRNFGPTTVPQDNYFVMGDNRDNSKDSRHFGFVEGGIIIGKAKGIILSFDITDDYLPRLKRFFAPLR